MMEKAVATWKKAIEKVPAWSTTFEEIIREHHNSAGWIYHRKGEIEKAILCFEKSIRLNADYLSLHPREL